MVGLYTPIFLLQAFCVYHAYQSRSEQHWYWIIIFFPGIGCAIYLFDKFYNRRAVDSIAENGKSVINTNYKIEQLEKELRFSDNANNKINLADAYVEYKRYNEAIHLYRDSLTGFMEDDPIIRMKLMVALFYANEYDLVIEEGKKLATEKKFVDSEAKILLAWAFYHKGDMESAERHFKEMDKPFKNYNHRIEFCRFLLSNSRREEGQSLADELSEEFEHMQHHERKLHSNLNRELRNIQWQLKNNASGASDKS